MHGSRVSRTFTIACCSVTRRLTLQVDVTATPRHNNGAIFVQTVSDYPLVEAIYQNVVKHPVLPDATSRSRLSEHQSAIFAERYADYLQLGVEEWRKSYVENRGVGQEAVLFVMVDDTRNCDEVGAHLERICPELRTVCWSSIPKITGKFRRRLPERARRKWKFCARHPIPSTDGQSIQGHCFSSCAQGRVGRPNVTVIVGLRAFAAASNILPSRPRSRATADVLWN